MSTPAQLRDRAKRKRELIVERRRKDQEARAKRAADKKASREAARKATNIRLTREEKIEQTKAKDKQRKADAAEGSNMQRAQQGTLNKAARAEKKKAKKEADKAKKVAEKAKQKAEKIAKKEAEKIAKKEEELRESREPKEQQEPKEEGPLAGSLIGAIRLDVKEAYEANLATSGAIILDIQAAVQVAHEVLNGLVPSLTDPDPEVQGAIRAQAQTAVDSLFNIYIVGIPSIPLPQSLEGMFQIFRKRKGEK